MTVEIDLPFGDASTWETELDAEVLAILVSACRTAETNQEKGSSLELLTCWLLAHLRGFCVMSSDTVSDDGSQEIDLSVYNDPSNSAIAALGPRIVVECKNRATNVSSRDVAWLYWKVVLNGADAGIMVSTSEITGSNPFRNGRAIIGRANAQRVPLLVVTLDDLEGVATTEGLGQLLLVRYMDLVVK